MTEKFYKASKIIWADQQTINSTKSVHAYEVTGLHDLKKHKELRQ